MTPRNRTQWGICLVGLVLLLIISKQSLLAGSQTFPAEVAAQFTFSEWVNDVEDWMRQYFRGITRAISRAFKVSLKSCENFLLGLPWVVVMLAVALPALKFGGLRLAFFCAFAVVFWGVVDMWKAAMETLSLIGISVVLSVLTGVFIGVLCSRSRLLWSVVQPVLDTMQTMPTFVYLIPAIFFFGTGDPPAVAATVIYAMPPAVRLTNLGIRQVSAEAIEVARAFGSTTTQTLLKVQLPLALPSIMLGINQTVMMALGMVVIATFIGAGGLGYEVWAALRRLKVGWALEGGLCIVFMAIMFDRLGYAISRAQGQRLDASFKLLPERFRYYGWARAVERAIGLVFALFSALSRTLTAGLAVVVGYPIRLLSSDIAQSVQELAKRHTFFVSSVTLLIALVALDRYVFGFGGFPETWEFSIRRPVDQSIKELLRSEDFYAVTTSIRVFVYSVILDPVAKLLEWLPWWYFTTIVGLVAWASAGRVVALVSVGCLIFIGAVDLWSITMFTLATIISSVVICFLIGFPIGIITACSNSVEAVVRPILDGMQTMPAFVYLIPVLMFFGANVVSAVIATIVYAVPPLIRLVNLGIREVSSESVEAANAFGSTFWQTLIKVKLPLALPSIMMGINQAVIFAVAMTVITPLIGGGGLGMEVFNALSVVDTGLGFEAGLSIVFIAVVMDRITQAWSRRRQLALGLQS